MCNVPGQVLFRPRGCCSGGCCSTPARREVCWLGGAHRMCRCAGGVGSYFKLGLAQRAGVVAGSSIGSCAQDVQVCWWTLHRLGSTAGRFHRCSASVADQRPFSYVVICVERREGGKFPRREVSTNPRPRRENATSSQNSTIKPTACLKTFIATAKNQTWRSLMQQAS